MTPSRDPREPDLGRVRRGRPWGLLALGLVVAIVVALPLLRRDGPAGVAQDPDATFSPPGGGVDVASLHGRLIYAASAADGLPGLRQRLVIYDLDDATIELGPRIPTSSELVAVDGSVIAIAEAAGGERAAFRVDPFDDESHAREIARGDLLEPSTDLDSLLEVKDAPPARGCRFGVYSVRLVPLDTTRPGPTAPPSQGCGVVLSATASPDGVTLTLVRGGVATTLAEPSGVVLTGMAVVSQGPTGTYLLVELRDAVEPSLPPTGPLLVWPGQGATRAASDGFVATRVLGWAPGGVRVVVNGVLDDQRAMWIVYPAAGTAVPILPSNRFDLGSAASGATFDEVGTVFGASAGVIVASTPSGVFPIALPSGAPVPVGPLVWMR